MVGEDLRLGRGWVGERRGKKLLVLTPTPIIMSSMALGGLWYIYPHCTNLRGLVGFRL